MMRFLVLDDEALPIHLMSLSNERKAFSYIREFVDDRYLRNANKITDSGLVQNAKVFRNLFSQIEISSAVLINAPEDRKPTEIYLQLFASPKMNIKVLEKDIVEPLYRLGYGKNDSLKSMQIRQKPLRRHLQSSFKGSGGIHMIFRSHHY